MNIVLIGMKHCGKSTVGTALSERLGCAFYDVDALIEEMHARDRNVRLSVRDIFSRYGEDAFHRLEAEAVDELHSELGRTDRRAVIALGGRTALNTRVRDLLPALGMKVYLRVKPETLYARIEQGGIPPFLQGADPAAAFMKLYHEREPQYRRLADVVVDLDGLDVASCVDGVLATIEECEHGRE